jgi:hypothetical protein
MNPRRTLIAAVAAAALAGGASAPAHAGSVPQTEGGVKCHHAFKKRYRLGKIVRSAETYGGHYPALAKPKYAKLSEAGTITLRPRWTKAARKILSHHARTKIFLMLGTRRTDGQYWSGPGDWGHSKVIR